MIGVLDVPDCQGNKLTNQRIALNKLQKTLALRVVRTSDDGEPLSRPLPPTAANARFIAADQPE